MSARRNSRTSLPGLLFSALLILAGLTIAASGQTATGNPDLNGTWKLNTTKSEFSPAPQPSSQTEVISVAGDTITVAFTSAAEDGRQKYTYTLKLGARETPLPKPEVNETALSIVGAKAEWKNAALVVSQTITYQGGPGTIVSTYTLSADGKTLTKTMNVAIDQGNFELKAVYDKA